MTRFARAKGSKASNERAPEDGTPWEVMKEQFLQAKKENEESKKRKEAEKQRIENYENFLKDHKIQKRKATWCDFPEVPSKKINTHITPGSEGSKQKNKNKNTTSKDQDITEPVNSSNSTSNEHTEGAKKPKKKKNKSNAINAQNENTSVNEDQTFQTNKGKKKKNKKKKNNMNSSTNSSDNRNLNDTTMSVDGETNSTPSTTEDQTAQGKKNKKKNKNSMKSNTDSSDNPSVNNTNAQNFEKQNFNNNAPKPKKNKKLVDGKPVRRKEINDRSFQLIINGKEIELVRFDGFPVMKKDADRLEELKNSMIKKGIPKSEVQRTMKLERRRAEKALARVKREVCYNCRKGGHVLSDCPELKSKIPGADAAEGVCFKCGSTEHRQFECKVQRDKEFRFATCFICKEPGHIARQCPDNPKGLYPNGGCCKLCGDVTHLRKDCPTVMDKKEETSVKLHTMDSSDNIEDVGLQPKLTTAETSKKPKKIMF